MEIVAVNKDMPNQLLIKHKGEEVQFDLAGMFTSRNFREVYNPFLEINNYWATLSARHQNQIWDCFKRGHEALEEATEVEDIQDNVGPILVELCDLHDPAAISKWINLNNVVRVPKTIPVEYVKESGVPYPREKTYIVEEYVELLGLVILLRAILPIAGPVIDRIRKSVGTNFKEYTLLCMLDRANFRRSPAMERLELYFGDRSDGAVTAASTKHILGGLSSSDLPVWTFGIVLFRRFIIFDFRGLTDNNTLISSLYLTVNGINRTGDATYTNFIVFKEDVDEAADVDGEDGTSFAERYKTKQDRSAGSIEVDRYFARSGLGDKCPINKLIDFMCPDVPQEIRDEVINYPIPEDVWYEPVQAKLLQNITSDIISPSGIGYLDAFEFQNLSKAAQAVLWHKGYLFFAAFVTAGSVDDNTGTAFGLGGNTARNNLPTQLTNDLNLEFPYRMKVRNKAPRSSIIEIITRYDIEISDSDWRPNCSGVLLNALELRANAIRLIIPSDIKIQLANLFIDIGRGNFYIEEN